MLESPLEYKVNDVCLFSVPCFSAAAPMMMIIGVNQVHSKQGLHLSFLLDSLCSAGGSLLLALSLWCV